MSTEIISVEAEEIPIEQSVEKSFLTQLEKLELTKQGLSDKKEECLQLKLNGRDKETYTLIRETRLNMKATRVAIEKVCKKGREDATRTQKAWLAMEKDFVKIVSEGEDYLYSLEEAFEKEEERIKAETKRLQEEAFILRQAELTQMGAKYYEGSFVLNDVSFEAVLVKESDNDVWEESIRPKFHARYLINEEARIADEKKKQEADALLQQQREEQEKKQQELEAREAAIKKAEEAAAKQEQDRLANERFEESQRIEKLWRGRLSELSPVGFNGQEAFAKYDETIIVATYDQLIAWSQEEFNSAKKEHLENVNTHEKKKEEKRQAEIEEQKRLAAEEATKKERERAAEELRQQEIKKKQDEEKKAKELEAADDKTKWQAWMAEFKKLPVLPPMKSPAYRTKASIAREKIEEIQSI